MLVNDSYTFSLLNISFYDTSTDIDECALDGDDQVCPDTMACVNHEGSYHCYCPPGFTSNGSYCEGIHTDNSFHSSTAKSSHCNAVWYSFADFGSLFVQCLV